MYWVNGTEDGDDLSHWSKTSGSFTPTGVLSNDETTVVFDFYSGLSSRVIAVSQGSWEAKDCQELTSQIFENVFDGSNGNLRSHEYLR